MIDTAIPDTVPNGLINFDKKRKEFEVLAQVSISQANTFVQTDEGGGGIKICEIDLNIITLV